MRFMLHRYCAGSTKEFVQPAETMLHYNKCELIIKIPVSPNHGKPVDEGLDVVVELVEHLVLLSAK